MLPAPLWLALVKAMLVVDDGTRITQLFLHGEGCDTRMPLFSYCQSEYTHMWGKRITTDKAFPAWGRCPEGADRVLAI